MLEQLQTLGHTVTSLIIALSAILGTQFVAQKTYIETIKPINIKTPPSPTILRPTTSSSTISLPAISLPTKQPQQTNTTSSTQKTSNNKAQSLYQQISNATINILCVGVAGGPLRSITGSGVIIDPRGVILTNAHIGQYFLFDNIGNPPLADCTIRTGSPATNSYKATILYLSPTWIQQNPGDITGQQTNGTGQYDYALLLISSQTNISASSNKEDFPYIKISSDENEVVGQIVLTAGYPAQYLTEFSIENDLNSVIAQSNILNIFSFSNGNKDILSLSDNNVARLGASGGPIIDTSNGNLIGMISTITAPTYSSFTQGSSTINAISVGHIDRSLVSQTGSDLTNFLSGDISGKSTQFNQLIAPELTSILERSLGYYSSVSQSTY